MSQTLALAILLLALAGSAIFSTLAYALRDYSRATLGEWFERRLARGTAKGRADDSRSGSESSQPGEAAKRRVEMVAGQEDELALTAAVARTGANLVAVLAIVYLVESAVLPGADAWLSYGLAFVAGLLIVGLMSVALPLAISSHAAEPTIGLFAGLLRLKRAALWPFVVMHLPIDRLVRRATGRVEDTPEDVEEELEKEILDIVREGRDEGVFGEGERQILERAIRFHDMTAEQAMTPRGDVVGLPHDATAQDVLQVIDETGYSRIPVYRETLDDVVGVLYARDLFRFVGKRLNGHESDETRVFDMAKIVRKPLVVPESKRLDDLLKDMQLQKIHMAIVLDEYGGTSGLVTIEDVLEELVGEIADEHEEAEDPMFRRVGAESAEADARIGIEELNRLMGLKLPEEGDFETLGGFVTTTLGRIPPTGTSFEYPPSDPKAAVFTVLDAEPQRVNRLRISTATPAPTPPAAMTAA